MSKGPLNGLTVIDASSIIAGPTTAMILADYGARVIKIEHPDKGDSIRNMGFKKDDVPLWWKLVSRNKETITLNLSKLEGQEILKKLLKDADILIENFRPGTMEKWGLDYDVLSNINKKLIMLRVTGFGQEGPYSKRPGFGTIAEAMSGFAYVNGFPDRPPTLPPFTLGDSVAGIYGSAAVMFALWHRDNSPNGGEGQVIDLSLYEPLFSILGTGVLDYDQLDMVHTRTGNKPPDSTTPRNTYLTSDDKWVALSASTLSTVERTVQILGLENDERFANPIDALKNVDELDVEIERWINRYTYNEVMEKFTSYQAAIGPVYNMAEIFEDPQYKFRDSIVEVRDAELGKLKMQGLVPRFSKTPGSIKFAGAKKGEYNDKIFKEFLGYSDEKLSKLKDKGII